MAKQAVHKGLAAWGIDYRGGVSFEPHLPKLTQGTQRRDQGEDASLSFSQRS